MSSMPSEVQLFATTRQREPLWPTLEQELLLKAALETGQRARDAWTAWRSRFDYERLDNGTLRLMPLLRANIETLGIADPLLGRMREVERLGWFKNQQLMVRLRRALEAFSAAGIETLLLKGLPLALSYYDRADLRPIGDIDIMILYSDWRAATEILIAAGWRSERSDVSDPLQRGLHAVAFRDREGFELDLHQSPFHECLETAKLEPFWEQALPLVGPGMTSRMLGATDQLLHCLVHGLRANDVSPVRWVADAVTILRRQPGLDWPRLLDQTRKLRLGQPVSTGLTYLAGTFPGLVPDAVIVELGCYKMSLFERIEWYARKRAGVTGQGQASRFGHFFRLYEGTPLIKKLSRLPRYLADIFGTTSGPATLRTLVRKLIRGVKGVF